MLTALLDGIKIISIDPNWIGRKEELRKLCNNIAVCPVCLEPIICKFGIERIHHFAHSRSANCPGEHETEEHMKGKAILYDFLQGRYKDLAEIELECVLPGLSTLCDIIIKFPDGKRWAVEFYSGHIKEAKLKEKIDYYNKENIEVLWLISSKSINKITSKCLKIKSAERNLIQDTGIDRFYPIDWYKKIVEQKIDYPIPKRGINRGSLYYFSVENKSIIIARGLKDTAHITIFDAGDILEGALQDIIISERRNVWCFGQETDWRSKLNQAEETLKCIKNEREIVRKKLAETKEIDYGLSRYSKGNHQKWPKTNGNPEESQILSQNEVIYTCTICNRQLPERDMPIRKLDTRKGSCRDCLYGEKR